jgi:formyltetrahydrofolate deformylase
MTPAAQARPPTAVLLLSCPDQQGIVATVAQFVLDHHGNITHADQHVDSVDGVFFQRVEFELDGFALAPEEIEHAFDPIARQFAMHAEVRFSEPPLPIAIMASKQPHCLYDLLTRWRTGELRADLCVVIDNHPDHAEVCAFHGVPYEYLPVDADDTAAQEARVLDVLARYDISLVVLARYMRILSPTVIGSYRHRMINIHHSFLPAFIGANPYRQALDRGVKLIGATAHYATEDLDEGPIIDQEVVRVSHRDDVAALTAKGRDLETVVLARAVRAHLDHRILVYGRKTVVFA